MLWKTHLIQIYSYYTSKTGAFLKNQLSEKRTFEKNVIVHFWEI